MRIKTLTDAAFDFRARALRHAHTTGTLYGNTDAGARGAAVEVLRLAADGGPYQGALNALDDQQEGAQYLCPLCNDTGVREGEACTCFKSYVYRECYGAADIDSLTESFDKFDMSLFDDEEIVLGTSTRRDLMAKIKKWSEKYAAEFSHPQKLNLILSGGAGLGKTFLLRCIAKSAKSAGADVLLIDYPTLHELFHAHRTGVDIDFKYLHSAGMLLLDDLGAEPQTGNVSIEYLFSLIDGRIAKGLPTAITTNVYNIASRYTEPIASRLSASKYCKNYFLEGRDLRKKK